jgi:hypothetical protein
MPEVMHPSAPLHSGFRATEKIATIRVSLGFIRGIADKLNREE